MLRKMLRIQHYWLSFSLILTGVTVALAGGFQLEAEVPSPAHGPQFKDAVLIVRTYGCRRPANATLSGTAEGIVGGRRQSVPLRFELTSTGVYAVKRLWPDKGVWVLSIAGSYGGATSSLLVELSPPGAVQAKGTSTGTQKKAFAARTFHRKIAAGEVEAALQGLARKTD